MKITEGRLIGTGLNIAVIASRFNELAASRLLDGTKDTLMRHDVSGSAIDIYRVPGALELPLIAQELALTGKYDAIIALGAVIHSDYIAAEISRGLANAALNHRVPVISGVIMCETLEQALAQAESKAAECALGAIETANLLRNIRRQNTTNTTITEERIYNA